MFWNQAPINQIDMANNIYFYTRSKFDRQRLSIEANGIGSPSVVRRMSKQPVIE